MECFHAHESQEHKCTSPNLTALTVSISLRSSGAKRTVADKAARTLSLPNMVSRAPERPPGRRESREIRNDRLERIAENKEESLPAFM